MRSVRLSCLRQYDLGSFSPRATRPASTSTSARDQRPPVRAMATATVRTFRAPTSVAAISASPSEVITRKRMGTCEIARVHVYRPTTIPTAKISATRRLLAALKRVDASVLYRFSRSSWNHRIEPSRHASVPAIPTSTTLLRAAMLHSVG